jgi:hypothetical protein
VKAVVDYRFEPAAEKRHPAHRMLVMEDVMIDGEAFILVPSRP